MTSSCRTQPLVSGAAAETPTEVTRNVKPDRGHVNVGGLLIKRRQLLTIIWSVSIRLDERPNRFGLRVNLRQERERKRRKKDGILLSSTRIL